MPSIVLARCIRKTLPVNLPDHGVGTEKGLILADELALKPHATLAERIGILREGFPEVFTEGKIDFEKLREALGGEAATGRERYGLSWAGKSEAVRNIQTPSVATLVPDREESVEFDATKNLFIEGDNLEVLKLLQKSYHGRVKMIYIDPPYNTGNEFIYPDNFREGIEDYLRYSGQVDDEGLKLSTNTETSGRYHSAWLSMMYPRLLLARNLLCEDGVIFVSVDDHEVHNLRHLMDEVFGEENLVENFVWKKSYGGGAKEKYAVTQHEYVLLYARNFDSISELWLPPDAEAEAKYYKYRDDKYESRGPYRVKPLEATKSMDERKNLVFPIPLPEGGEVWPKRQWWWSRERVFKTLAEDGLVFTKGKDGVSVSYKQYLRDEEGNQRGAKPFSVIDGIYTQQGTADLEALFDGQQPMQFTKPVALIELLLHMSTSPNEEDLVLDFFAGSGTTAQATLKLNAEDGGDRKFILVQLPEPTDNPDYPTIADIGKERIRRVIRKLNDEDSGRLKMEDGKPQDRGFKVFKLTSSNFETWDGEAPADSEDASVLEERLLSAVENVKSDRSREDILYEVLLRAGWPLTTEVGTLGLADGEVFSAETEENGAMFVCLEDPITEGLLREMMDQEPAQVVCLDTAFHGNDQLKTNTVLEMRDRGIEFRTI
jgi:adenine-specific DNA-methyltransferase